MLFFLLLLLCHGAVNAQTPLDAELSNYPYPYKVHYFEVEVQRQKLKMAYMHVAADKPNGETITLFHGKNFCGAYFERVIRDLASAGYTVIVPDQIGFGKSSKPQNLQYSFHQLAQNTKQLLDSLKITKTHVLGHSMGGMVAARFALMYGDQVPKLILENPIGLEDWKKKVPYQTVEDWYAQELKSSEESIRNYQKQNYYHGEWKPEYEKWVQLLNGWRIGPNRDLIAWNSALTYDMVFTQPVLYEFGDVKPQTLLIIGELDRTAIGKNLVPEDVRATMGNYPGLSRAAADAIPRADLVLLKGVGHIPHIEDYGSFWAALSKFLSQK